MCYWWCVDSMYTAEGLPRPESVRRLDNDSCIWTRGFRDKKEKAAGRGLGWDGMGWCHGGDVPPPAVIRAPLLPSLPHPHPDRGMRLNAAASTGRCVATHRPGEALIVPNRPRLPATLFLGWRARHDSLAWGMRGQSRVAFRDDEMGRVSRALMGGGRHAGDGRRGCV